MSLDLQFTREICDLNLSISSRVAIMDELSDVGTARIAENMLQAYERTYGWGVAIRLAQCNLGRVCLSSRTEGYMVCCLKEPYDLANPVVSWIPEREVTFVRVFNMIIPIDNASRAINRPSSLLTYSHSLDCFLPPVPSQFYSYTPYRNGVEEINADESLLPHSANIVDLLGFNFNKSHGGNYINGKEILYGVELELAAITEDNKETVGQYINKNREVLGAIAKRDGSLGQCGFEIVTIPATMANNFTRIKELLISPSVEPHLNKEFDLDGYGLHIHASRVLTDKQTCALDFFVNNNMELFKSISRRNDNYSYCEFNRRAYKNNGIRGEKRSKYRAVNILDKTIEFRFFKSTLNIDELKLAMQCVESLCMYFGTIYNSKHYMKDLRFDSFYEYLSENPKYAVFYNAIKEFKTGRTYFKRVHMKEFYKRKIIDEIDGRWRAINDMQRVYNRYMNNDVQIYQYQRFLQEILGNLDSISWSGSPITGTSQD